MKFSLSVKSVPERHPAHPEDCEEHRVDGLTLLDLLAIFLFKSLFFLFLSKFASQHFSKVCNFP